MEEERKPLRAISPKLYMFITKELEKQFHIQPYDVQVDAIQKDEGMQISVRFGEQFSQQVEQFFSSDALWDDRKQLQQFIQKTGESCKDVLIKNYFRMMAP